MGKRIMIVDDAKFMREMLKAILTKSGYEVVGEAGNGHEAIKMYQKCKPDLVTMDITMPEMNGIEGVKAIRGIDPDANIIMCSAMSQQSMVLSAIQAGAKSFIVKPFKADQIVKVIEKTLTRSAAKVEI